MRVTPKARLISIIVALVFMASAIIGSGTYLIINHLNNANATTSTSYIIQDNLYNTDGTLNNQAVYDFLDAIGYIDNPNDTNTYKANQILSRNNSSSYAGDKTIVFKMGYYVSPSGAMDTDKPIVWQATYLRNGYLTIWMANSYTSDYFNNGTSSYSDWKTSSTSYSQTGNYSNSLIREVTNNIYGALNTSLNSLSSFIVSPYEASATWQATQANAFYDNTSYWSITNGMETNSNSGSASYQDKNDCNPYSWSWDDTVYKDKFWLPSHVEIFNTPEQSSAYDDRGLWGITSANDRKDTSSSALDGKSTRQCCWLRSGDSYKSLAAMQVFSSGSALNSYVYISYGVRPAAHISLSSLADLVSYTITAQSNNASYGTMSGGGIVVKNSSVTLRATPNSNYQFLRWECNGVTVSTETEITFTATQSATYIAIFEYVPITLNITGNSGSYTSTIDYNSKTQNATIVIYPAVNDYINTIWLDSNSPQIVDRWNDYVYQDSAAFQVSYKVSDFSNTIVVNIELLKGDITININLAHTPPTLQQGGGTNISGVALQVSASGGSTDLAAVGEARITGYNQTEDLSTIHVSAMASTGYAFVGWEVDGEIISTLLSTDIPYEDVEGKIIVAVFEPINTNSNSVTDNNQTNDFI